MNPPVSAPVALCLERNVHCLWTWASHVGIMTHRTLLKILMPCVSGTRWRWPMTRLVVILVRPFSDKSAFMINGLSDTYLLWGIGPCVITHQLRSVNWSRPGLAVGVQLQPDSPIILVHCQDRFQPADAGVPAV